MTFKRLHLLVEGRVQGVSFRAYTQEQARKLGLTGFVSNRPDGRVEIVAEGSQEALEALQDWCWQGSPAAEVTAVEAQSAPASGEFSRFSAH